MSGPAQRHPSEPPLPRVHPLKRAAARFARALPAAWRFPVCGLPDPPAVAPASSAGDVASIPRGTATHLGAHLDAGGRLIGEGGERAVAAMQRRFLQRQRFFPRVRRVAGTMASIATDAHTNYFHWMFEALPRLRVLRQAGADWDALYACQRSPFQRASLAGLGIDSATVIDSTEAPFARADTLLLPRIVNRDEPWIPAWLVEGLAPLAARYHATPLPRRLYISRRKSASRGVANEAEVRALLGARGFHEVFLEELSLGEQIALFQHAEAVVGPHGAGFTNVIFCAPGTLVLELMGEGYPSEVYLRLGRGRGLNHHLVPCRVTGGNVHSSPIQVELPRLAEFLGR
ncbi:MAG: glycosyltransferase family 61 protein [Verrucomicrobiota bacterium]